MKKKLLGHVGVDSGQLVITDPCYIDSEWEKKDMVDIRIYKHKKTGKLLKYNSQFTPKDKKFKGELFDNYKSITSFKKSMNELLTNKEVEEMPVPEKLKLISSFSYAGVCETTMADKHQINYKLGHPGAAVAFSSGLGDGYYPVYGYFQEGRCWKVEIDCGLTQVQRKFIQNELKPKRDVKKGSKRSPRK